MQRVDPSGRDESIVENESFGALVQVNPGSVGTVHDDVASRYAAAILEAAASVSTEALAGRSITEGKPDTLLSMVLPFAAYQVLFEQIVFSGTLEEDAIARAVALCLSEVGNEVPLHAPAAGGHDIQRAGRTIRFPCVVVEKGIVTDDSIVGEIATYTVHFDGGVEVGDPVVLDHNAHGVTDNVKGVLAAAVGLTSAVDHEVLEDPI